jgi:hypothetical protein
LFNPKHKLSLKLFLTKCLLHFKKNRYTEYSANDIQQFIAPNFPVNMPVIVPKGQGSLTLLSAKISMPTNSDQLYGDLFTSLDVNYLSNPIYRAHVLVTLAVKPIYDQHKKEVYLTEAKIVAIKLLQDEYSIIKDYQNLMALFIPSPMLSLVTGSIKSALSMMTNSLPREISNYLQLYVDGSKQKVLDFHKPQLKQIVTELTQGDLLRYKMDETIWEEYVFSQIGKEVRVEEGKLRFKF